MPVCAGQASEWEMLFFDFCIGCPAASADTDRLTRRGTDTETDTHADSVHTQIMCICTYIHILYD